MAFCVRLTYFSDFTVPGSFVRGMQLILFYNVVYVYVCKIGEEKFGGCWRSFS